MNNYYDIIKRPIITEKSMGLNENIEASINNNGNRNKMKKEYVAKNRYVFEVAKDANKIEIAKAVEKAFNVTVENVTVVNVLPKAKRVGQHAGFKSAYKKAYVTLKAGDKIDSFNL
jgi:large subunit ribosomal protein L23